MKRTLLKRDNRGFTLIELLVVIAIIGILTAIISSNFTAAKSKARDAKRISDIAQLQLTLEQYFDKCNFYPLAVDEDTFSVNSYCTGSDGVDYKLNNFISRLPKDPTGAEYKYVPINILNNVSGSLDYVLRVTLENNNPALIDDVDGTLAAAAGVECGDNPETDPDYHYCVQPK